MSSWNPETTPSFTPQEMACSRTGLALMDQDFMQLLQNIRYRYGKPMIVTSGYRDPVHHAIEKRKDRPGSHAAGMAADIAVDNALDRFVLTKIAIEEGAIGIGQGAGFVHIDRWTGPTCYVTRPAMWKYGS